MEYVLTCLTALRDNTELMTKFQTTFAMVTQDTDVINLENKEKMTISKFFTDENVIDYDAHWKRDNKKYIAMSQKHQLSHDKFKYIVRDNAVYNFTVDGDQVELTKLVMANLVDPKDKAKAQEFKEMNFPIVQIRDKEDHNGNCSTGLDADGKVVGKPSIGSRGIGPDGKSFTMSYLKTARKAVIHVQKADESWVDTIRNPADGKWASAPHAAGTGFTGVQVWKGVKVQ